MLSRQDQKLVVEKTKLLDARIEDHQMKEAEQKREADAEKKR